LVPVKTPYPGSAAKILEAAQPVNCQELFANTRHEEEEACFFSKIKWRISGQK
jgi:hypothetical protein